MDSVESIQDIHYVKHAAGQNIETRIAVSSEYFSKIQCILQ